MAHPAIRYGKQEVLFLLGEEAGTLLNASLQVGSHVAAEIIQLQRAPFADPVLLSSDFLAQLQDFVVYVDLGLHVVRLVHLHGSLDLL